MPTRQFGLYQQALQQGQKAPVPKIPTTKAEWQALLNRAIAKAESVGDRRVAGLRSGSDPETLLRQLGLVSDADIEREFSESKR